nr:ATP-binding protein [uncultured Mucilaginibacter sp.]
MRSIFSYLIRYCAILALLVLICNRSTAQQHFAFTPINTTNGLANNEVRNITQLQDGRMVIITNGIINIYNGTTFEYIHTNAQYHYALKGYLGYLRSYVENKERLWLKNQGQLMLIDNTTGRFEKKADSVLAHLGVHGPLADLFMDDAHNLWFLTGSDQLLYRNQKTGKLISFLSRASVVDGKRDMLYDIAVMNRRVYLFYKSGAYVGLDMDTRRHIVSGNSLSSADQAKYSSTLFPVQKNNDLYQLRTGPGGGVLLWYDLNKNIWQKLLEVNYALNYLSISQKGDLLISCTQGLWFFDRRNFEKQQIKKLEMVDGTSVNTEVSTLYFDNQDGLWIGTLNHGLLYYHPDRFKFRNLGRSFFPDNSGEDITISCFSEKKNGNILVGTYKGLFEYNREASQLTRFSPATTDISCTAMIKGKTGRIWLCTTTGLYCITDQSTRYYPVGNINHVVFDRQNNMYLQTEDNGFGKFDPLSGEYKRLAVYEKRIVKVNQMVFWKGLLIGMNNNGLFTYNIKKKTVSFPNQYGDKVPAMYRHGSHNYKMLFVDSRGLLWFGTQDGLYVWDEGKQHLTTLNDTRGLVNNSIKGIIEDAEHTLWISTSGGVSRIRVGVKNNERTYSMANFNTYDGVIKEEFARRSVYISKDNHLLLGGINGFNEIDLDRFTVKPRKLLPLFTSFKVFGEEIRENKAYNGNRILTRSISSTTAIALNNNQNFFTISFTGLNYVNPTQTYYRYILDGVDAGWHEISTADGIGRITYTGVSPGSYTLKVKATDNSSDWNSPVITMDITVRAPFWRTPIAIILYITLALIAIYTALKFYLWQSKLTIIRRQKQKLDLMKINFLTNMGHELRTPLSLILTPLESVLKKTDDQQLKSQLDNIHKNASNMLNIVNNLVDFKQDEFKGESLRLNFVHITDIIEPIVVPFRQVCEEKAIKFHVDMPAEEIFLYLDRDKLTKMVNNLLSNAFKFTRSGGLIQLQIRAGEQNRLIIRVTDSGVGIAESDLSKIFNRYFQAQNQVDGAKGSGIGLNMVKEYVELHGGEVTVTSQVNEGSEFTLSIPMGLQPTASRESVPKHTGDKRHRVLCVEDNEVFRNFMEEQLGAFYEVATAADGTEGLAKMDKFQPDLVISDITMPEMDGIELCKKIKGEIRTSHTPVILLTARYNEEVQSGAYHAGADAYITKPFNLDILLLRISKLIAQQEQRKMLFKNSIVIQPDQITTTSVDQELIEKVIRYIEKNIQSSSYSVEQLSSDMNMDRTGLYRKLMAITGQAPTEFIRSVKLKKAAHLLSQKRFSQQEIAAKVGFGTAAYFSKCFKDEYGVSPSQYKG